MKRRKHAARHRCESQHVTTEEKERYLHLVLKLNGSIVNLMIGKAMA